MATLTRWQKTVKTTKERYGEDAYKKIGSRGGKSSMNNKNKGFASNKVGGDGLTGRQRAKKYGVGRRQVSKCKRS